MGGQATYQAEKSEQQGLRVGKELLAPCGLYCGVCGVYIAHRDNNIKFKERLTTITRAVHLIPFARRCRLAADNSSLLTVN